MDTGAVITAEKKRVHCEKKVIQARCPISPVTTAFVSSTYPHVPPLADVGASLRFLSENPEAVHNIGHTVYVIYKLCINSILRFSTLPFPP